MIRHDSNTPIRAILYAASIILSSNSFAAPNQVYVGIDGQFNLETVSISKSADHGSVSDDSVLQRDDFIFNWNSISATLGHGVGGESYIGTDPRGSIDLSGTVSMGWHANYIASGDGPIDLDIDFWINAWVLSPIIREEVNSSSKVSYAATLTTPISSISLFDGSTDLRVENQTTTTLIETGGFVGNGVTADDCSPCTQDIRYFVQPEFEDLIVLASGDMFSITVEAIAHSQIVSTDNIGDILWAQIDSATTLSSNNPTASFVITKPSPVPLPGALWLMALACSTLLRLRIRSE